MREGRREMERTDLINTKSPQRDDLIYTSLRETRNIEKFHIIEFPIAIRYISGLFKNKMTIEEC